MKLPRDVSGEQLAKSLRRFGQTGSHMRLTSRFKDVEHHVTVPLHDPLKVGTFAQVLADVAAYLGITRDELIRALFH